MLLFFHVGYSSNAPKKLEIRHFILPYDGLTTIIQSERDVPIVAQADVVVAGGGVAGIIAALCAAEEGLSVILIESRNYFGQEFTASYKSNAILNLPFKSSSFSEKLFKEMVKEKVVNGDELDPVALKTYLNRKILEQSKIRVFLFSLANGVILEDKKVRGVIFSGRSGRQAVLAKAVVDATEDGRIALASGAKLSRELKGEKTVRRFIAANLTKPLTPGPLKVHKNLGVKDDIVVIHNRFVEFALSTEIGENIAADLSAIHAKTLKKSFELRDYFLQEGIVMREFTPSPETWIDEMPTLICENKWEDFEFETLNFSNSSGLKPVGVECLLIAGRTVSEDVRMNSLEALMGSGESAGKSVAGIAKDISEFTVIDRETFSVKSEKGAFQVFELLEGIETDKAYPFIHQSSVKLPVWGDYDVLVIGGGTSGALSAIAAAREGASVAVVEILPNLGGIGSNDVLGYYWGIPWKSLLRQELGEKIQLMKSNSNAGALEKVSFSGELKKFTLQNLAIQAGVDIFYQSLGTGVLMEGNQVKGVIVENSLGRHVLLSKVIIDATGLAGIAVAAGADFSKGRSTDGFVQEIEHGPLRDPTNLLDISASYLKFPSETVSLNIRESRRIIGDYVVTFDDVIHERNFTDVICKWRSNYDTHFPNSANQSDLAQDWTSVLGLWRKPIIGSIPYRSLLPKGVENILVAGMIYSADHDALIGGRMQPDLEHLGEAAGIAAAMASQMNVSPREIPVEQLQEKLVRKGVLRNEDILNKDFSGGLSEETLYRQDLWKVERDKQFPARDIAFGEKPEDWILFLGKENSLDAMAKLYLAGEKVTPLLKPLLKSDNRQVKEEVSVVLGLLNDKSAIPSLLEILKERNTRRFEYKLPFASSRPSVPLYWTSVILLGRFGEKKAVQEMMNILSGALPPEQLSKVRRTAYGLDMFETPDQCPPPLVSFIIVALGRIGDPIAINAIKPFLKVSNQLEPQYKRDLDNRPYLSVANQINIRDENIDFEVSWGIQTNAAIALAEMGDYSGVPVLIELLNSEQAQLRNYAQKLLEKITGKHFGKERLAWENWWRTKN
jgi:flavin-dependent dehydrogenase/HEAT repeat protein